MIRVAWVLVLILAGQTCGIAAEPGRPIIDWRAWATGPALADPGPTGDLLAIGLAEGGELARVSEGYHLTLQGDLGLLLRERSASRENEIRRRDSQLSWSFRKGAHWLGARFRYEDSLIRLRNVHTDDDFLVAERKTNSWRIGAGAEYGTWILQAAAGRSRGLEYSAGLSCDLGGTRLYIGTQLDRSEWIADQAFAQRRYVFRFPFRRETLLLTSLPANDRLPRFRAWREILVSDVDETLDDYNLFFRRGYGGEIFWKPGWRDASLEGTWFAGDLNLKMMADKGVYLDLEGAKINTSRIRALTPTGPWGLRLDVSREELRVDAAEGSFESWAFLFWDVFDPDRVLLERFHYNLDVVWLGLDRRFEFGSISEDDRDRNKRGSLDLNLSYGWVSGGGDAQWLERVWILWPFVFDYDPAQKEMPGLERNLLRLNTSLAFRINPEWNFNCRAQQLVPLIKGQESESSQPATASSAGKFTYGGLTLSASLEWAPGF